MSPFILIVILVIVGVLTYMYSTSTRKFYVCPECGERMRTEHGSASHCNTCGASLNGPID